MNVHSGKQKGFHDIWFYDYKLVLKLKAYYLGINDMEIDTDGLCMAYAQHQYELLKGGLRVSEFLAIRLGALAFYLNKGPYKESEIAIIDINLMDYVPKSLIKSLSPGIWLEKIGFEYEEIKGMSPYEAMKGYLDFLAPNEMFLAQGFPVYYIKIIEKAVESAKIKAICAVKPKEVLFLEENTRKLINKYDLKQILKFGVNKEVFFLMVTEDGATHFCESKAAESINYLIKAYINISLGRGIDYKEEY